MTPRAAGITVVHMPTLDPAHRARLSAALQSSGVRATSRAIGVAHGSLKSACAGLSVSGDTVDRIAEHFADRITPKVRAAEHVPALESTSVRPPRERNTAHSWSVEAIRAARDGLMRGEFRTAVSMAIEMRTNASVATARRSRLAPLMSYATELTAHDSARGRALCKRAAEHCIIPAGVLAGINATAVDFGFAVGYNDIAPNDDGTAITFRHHEWPIEHVRWDEQQQLLLARTDGDTGDYEIPIVHGDGRWTVYRTFDDHPWQQDSCVASACLVWAGAAMADADWASLLRSHGMAKLMGKLPEGEPTVDETGALTPRARSFLQMLTDLASGDAAAGITPPGGEADFVVNGSTAYQIFDLFVTRKDRAAARIYCGTDAALGSIGGAPGVDISQLFGVLSTLLQSDVRRLEVGLTIGVLQPWTIANTGSSALAPSFHFLVPDPDEAKRQEEHKQSYTRFAEVIKALRDSGAEITQEVIDRVAGELGIPAPTIASTGNTANLMLAPTDIAKVVRVREARAAQGLPPFGDTRDELTLLELEEALKAKSAAAAAAAQAPAAT